MNTLSINDSDKYFRLLAQNSIVGIIMLSKDCDILFANDFFCSLVGYTKQELLTMKISDITHPDDIQQCIFYFKSITENNEAGFQIEKRYITKKGEIVWCEMNIATNKNIEGEVEILSGIINNITLRKQIEKQVFESQVLFSSIFKNSPVAIVLGSIENKKYLDVNDSFTRYMGYSKDEIIGKSSDEIILFEDTSEKDKMISKVLEKGYLYGYEIKCKTKYGKILTTLFSITIVKAYDQNCLLFTAIDISERISTEKALKESESNYNTLVNFLPDGIAVHKNGKIVYANSLAINMLEGNYETDFLGLPVIDIVHPDYRQIVLDRIKTTNETNQRTQLIEEVFISLKGNPFFVEVASLPFLFEGEKAILVVFRDISERKIAESELIKAKNKAEESDKLKSSFLANMSHEIRTPMNAIKGFAQLLNDPDLTTEKKSQFVKIINQRTDDLLMLINDILDTAKIEAGQLTITETEDNIILLLNDLNEFFTTQQEISNQRDVELKVINPLFQSQIIFTSDFFRLRQIFINLINNALKFTEKGHVYFGCKGIENEHIIFFVEDTGIGIPEEMKELVFAPFRQLNDKHISRQKGGTGLGLSIVNGLLKLMNGKVWFNSEEEKGTTFYFSIPFKQSINERIETITIDNEIFNWDNKTILVVEDDEFNSKLIIEFLQKTKVKLLIAKTGIDAIQLFKKNREINLILMDIQLPDINGFELTQMFKTLQPTCKVIAQTAYAAEPDKKRALSSGCIDFISKPLVQIQLLKIVQKHLYKN